MLYSLFNSIRPIDFAKSLILPMSINRVRQFDSIDNTVVNLSIPIDFFVLSYGKSTISIDHSISKVRCFTELTP